MSRNKILRLSGCLLLIVFVSIAALWLYQFAYTDLGRITYFIPLTEGTIPGTNNDLIIQRDRTTLKHIIFQVDQQTDTKRTLITGYTPEYTTLEHNNKTYTIIRMTGQIDNGLYEYLLVLPDPRHFDGVYACSNPKLTNSTLEFYDPTVNRNHCNGFPFGWHEFPVFEEKLDYP